MPETYPIAGSYENLTKPIVQTWDGLFRRARECKKVFTQRSDQVMAFYSGGAGSMWQPEYFNRFLNGGGNISPPKFKVTLNIAFEQVAILGPLLFWQMADRKVKPHRSLQLDPEILSGGNPQLTQYFTQLAQLQATEDARNDMRCQVLEHILNYFQREQPGTLAAQSDLGIFEALTKGAGFLRTNDYRFPFSDRTLVGSFFTSVDDILIDPECRDPLWTSARWLAIRHINSYEEVEEYFKLPAGSMKSYANLSSQGGAFQVGGTTDAKLRIERNQVEWYEVFSRAGMGTKLVGSRSRIEPEFDKARGDDFAYLCICPTCPFPLNLTSRSLVQPYADSAFVKHQTDWPTEYWRDNKWPVSKLDFYPHSGTSPWPEPPLAPAIGALTVTNILISAYTQQVYDGRQSIVGYLKGAIDDINKVKDSTDSPLMIEIQPELNRTVNEVIQFLNRPEVNADLPMCIEFMRGLIEKSTGLSDMLYGGNTGANPRSATEYQGKLDTVNIRPEHMQKKVAAWQSEVADKEVFCAYIHVAAEDISEQLGPLGVPAWQELVTNEDPEAILRGSKCLVEASDIRRPNKAKDSADLQGMQQYLLPILAGELAQSRNSQPINGFIKALGDASEIDVDGFLLPEQEPDPLAQQMQQAELAKTQAESEKLRADAQKSLASAQSEAAKSETAQSDSAMKAQVAEHGMMIKQQTADHAIQTKERQLQLDFAGTRQDMMNKQRQSEQAMQQRALEARQNLGIKLMEASQSLHQNAATHVQQTAISDQQASDEARRGNMISLQKMLMAKAQHDQQQQMAQNGSAT